MWSVERVRDCITLTFDEITKGWKQSILITSDRHWDNPHSDQQLQQKHLERAKELNAPVIDLGDFFCLMEGRYDPRRIGDVRPAHQGEDYFDRVLDDAERFFEPYAEQFAVIGRGNHETSVLKHNQIDFTRGIARRLRRQHEHDWPLIGGYSGWLKFFFLVQGGIKRSLWAKYHHGYGGGGPVTRGVIQTNRRAVYLPDAQFVFTGHIHEAWVLPIKRERINRFGIQRLDTQWHVSVPTYKQEYTDNGYHIEKGRPPKPIGCVWLEFELVDAHKSEIGYRAWLDI